METKQSIQMEIHDTIIHLCKEIKATGICADTADMVKATAQLIEASKGYAI